MKTIMRAIAAMTIMLGLAAGVSSQATAAVGSCSLSSLPSEASTTVSRINSGGPFPYPRNDGVTFQNREGILPAEASGYYREYTVPTPGASNRGARRIVTGGNPATSPPHYYYTGDHYSSFCRVSG